MIIRHTWSVCVVASFSLISCTHMLRLYIPELGKVSILYCYYTVCVWYNRKQAKRDMTAHQKEERYPWHQFSQQIAESKN